VQAFLSAQLAGVAMYKGWKAIVAFAVLGFAITAGFYVFGTYLDYTKPSGPLELVMAVANVVLCPPTLIFAACIDCEYGTPAGLVTNLITVGLLNAGLYAAVGMAVAARRKKRADRD
jgi:hypothetical protein